MKRWKLWMRMWAILLMAVAAVALSSACKRRSGAERALMASLAGTWEWREAKVAEPTVAVLELAANGKYKETTYRELRKQRKLVYIKRQTGDVALEPDDRAAIAKLKKEGFEPAIDEGTYRLSLDQKPEMITFESDSPPITSQGQSSGVRELTFILSGSKLLIGGRTYQR